MPKALPVAVSPLQSGALLITHQRGPMTRQIRDVLVRHGGEAAWRDFADQLSPECQAAFSKEIGTYEWVEARHSTELSLAFLARGKGDPAFTQHRSEAAAQELLTSLNRWLLRMLSPTFLLNAIPRLFGLYHRGGRVTVDEVTDFRGQLSLWAQGFYPAWYAEGIPSFLRASLEAAGAKQVVVRYTPPQGDQLLAYRHQYEVLWK